MSGADPASPRFQRVERLAGQLRREIELGILAGDFEPRLTFDIIVRRSDDTPALRGRFNLEPMRPR